jgi:GTP-binding protein YchF
MEIAILGLKQSGKSTLFRIMTGINSAEVYGESTVPGIAKVPDERFDHLVEVFKPAKVTPASIPFVDVNAHGEKAWDDIRSAISRADSLLHIVDCFSTSDGQEMIKRYKMLESELIISDLMIVEKRIERLAKIPANTLKPDETIQLKIMPGIREHLEEGKPLREMSLTSDELHAIKNFSFWSLRPELVVLNISEGAEDPSDEFKSCTKSPAISICCSIEAEIAQLHEHERAEFLKSLGIETPAFEKIVQTAFHQLGRIYYFTVGEDEVRAWIVKEGVTAPQAAAVIHKDFERGFIKAEVVGYDDFIACGETLAGAKAQGKQRLEGKDYVVKDGDIISFRFNV